MSEPLLELKNIETYYGPIMAIRGVSLVVPEGSIVAVLGANGAGKTTILKTISGIMDPRKGRIVFQGRRVEGKDPAAVVRRGISHVPEGREVFPLMTVAENLRMGAFLRRAGKSVEDDVERMFGYFPVLRERAHQAAGDLSGGEQQMLAIARALLARPKLLLLDEPSLGLSPRLVKEIFAIIRRLNEEGLTILLVEQNANVALQTAHYGYILEVGRIVLEGACTDLRENESVKEFYLGLKDQGVRGTRRWKRRRVWR